MALEGSYEELYQRAMEAVAPDRPDEAIPLFRKLVDRLAGMSAELRSKGGGLNQILAYSGMQLATLYRWKGDYPAAQETLDRMDAAVPGLKDSWNLVRSLTLIDSGETEKGLDILRGLTMQHPEDRSLRLTLAQELSDAGRTEDAERTLRRLARDKRESEMAAEANVRLSQMYLTLGNWDAAIEAWKQAGTLEAGAKGLASSIYDWLLAHGEIDRLASLLPDDGNALRANLYLGRISAARGDQDEAQRRWTKVLEAKPDDSASSMVSACEALLHLGRAQDALALLSVAFSRDMGGDRFLLLSAVALAVVGRIEASLSGLGVVAKSLVQSRPRRTLMSAEDWWLVAQYVTDADLLAQMRPYFDVPQDAPDAAPSAPEAPEALAPEADAAPDEAPAD